VITPESKTRILQAIAKGEQQGKVLLDGRKVDQNKGNFLKPTVISDLSNASELTDAEIFGPVLSLRHANDLDDAIDILSKSAFGNAASIFTTSGPAARKFRYEVPTGNVGVNIGVAAHMAYFPFSGWKDSFLGVLH